MTSSFPDRISSLSLENVNVRWRTDFAGTSTDPTGQTPGQAELPVQFAFPASSGDVTGPASPSAWFTGSWLQDATGLGYVAECLVGPGGGVTQLAAGRYDVWSKVTGGAESPVRFVGVLTVY